MNLQTYSFLYSFIFQPFSLGRKLLSWLLAEAFILASDLYNWNQYAYASAIDDDQGEIVRAVN